MNSDSATFRWPDRLRLPLAFDPARLERDLRAAAAHDWIAHFVRQNYEGDWSAIPLRSVAGTRAQHPVMQIYSDPVATAFEDAPPLDDCPYFREVIAAFRSPVRCVRLMRLAAGSTIKEHTDLGLDAEAGTVRIHIPVTTNPGVVFEVNRRPVPLAPGSAWYLRLSDPHRVENRGDTDRVSLVLDADMDGWMEAMLSEAVALSSAPSGSRRPRGRSFRREGRSGR